MFCKFVHIGCCTNGYRLVKGYHPRYKIVLFWLLYQVSRPLCALGLHVFSYENNYEKTICRMCDKEFDKP